MISAILSFLGGSAFRMIWSQIASYIDNRQEHQHELERMRLEKELDDSRHARECERLRLQSSLGVTEFRVQADADVSRLEAQAFVEAVKLPSPPTGIPVVDGWNGSIRPMAATIAIFLWVAHLVNAGFVMNEWDRDLCGVVIGFFFASRALVRDRDGK